MQLGDLTWQDVDAGALLVVPLGSTEQHGPHLPLSTDSDIALALCDRLAASRPGVVVAPLLPYGSSGEHAGFPGTLSIGQDALEFLLLELGRSAGETFPRLLFVSAHGGNAGPVTRSVTRLRAEGRDVRAWAPSGYVDAHAGRTETSLQLALDASRVRLTKAAAGNTRSMAELLPHLVAGGVRSVSANGVLGDPAGASETEGRELLDRLAAALVTFVDQVCAPPGRSPRRDPAAPSTNVIGAGR